MKISLTETQRREMERWIAALESGHYKQGEFQLQDQAGRYCCLGVLCQITNPGRWQLRSQRGWDGEPENEWQFDGYTGLPPEDVLARVGLSVDASYVLTNLNDIQGKSFKEIAAYLRETYLN